MLSITLLRIVCSVINFILFVLSLFMMALLIVKKLVRDLSDSLSTFVRNVKATLNRTSEAVTAPNETTQSSVPAAESIPDSSNDLLLDETLNTSDTVIATQSAVQPSEPRHISIPTTHSSINVSRSNTTDKVKTVGSVKRLKEKLTALFDMMDERNLQAKCEEIKTIIVETENKCLPWLARHIVSNRISTEKSHHAIYLCFLNALNNEQLTEYITLDTEKNIKELISEDRVSTIPICRKTLNNLGSWYGLMTLGRNKPISTTFGDLKILLIKAYQSDGVKMSYILPLVSRILESCSISTVFSTTSLWTLDVLNCLGELHCQTDFELKFRFEIELLMKKLTVELQDLKPAKSYFTKTA